MFLKTEKTRPKPPPEPVRHAPSIISINLHIVGNLVGDGEIQIDGRVEGDVRTKSLTVGETAYVTGEIVTDEVSIRGRVDGTIRSRMVRLFKTAQVTSDVLHEAISIESGATIEGQLKRADRRPTEAPKLGVVEKASDASLAPTPLIKPLAAG